MKHREITASKKANGKIQYLTEILPEIPTNTILYKKLTGLGATYGELKAHRNSIIIEPNKPVISGKCKDPKHGKDNLFGVFDGVYADDIVAYMERSIRQNKYFKILTTPESFHKVQEAFEEMDMDIRYNSFLLFDECHKIVKDSGFRPDIALPMDLFFECENKALVSATPIEFTDPRFEQQKFQTITIKPTFDYVKDMNLHATNNLLQAVKEVFAGLKGNCFIFCNSTDTIYSLILQLGLLDKSAVFCSEKSVEKLKGLKFENVSDIWDKNIMKRYNWLTSRFYNAVDIKLNENPNVILLSNCYLAEFTTIDPFTDSVQIAGRFRNGIGSLKHIVNINPNFRVQSKEEVRGYIRGLEAAHQILKQFRDTAPDTERRNIWWEYITCSPFNRFLDSNGQKSYFLIDNYVDDEVVKGYYSDKAQLYSAYQQCDTFNVYMEERIYRLGDYERLKMENPKLTVREKRMQIVELLEMLGACETRMEIDYRKELEESDPFIVEAYDTLGKAAIEHLRYRETMIREAMILKCYHEKSTGTEAIQLIRNSFKENTWYADSFIKKELQRIFKLLGIKYPKAVTSHTIGDFFEYVDKPTKKKRGKRLYKFKF
ncbi:DEAD/DEAH box helicase family protein [Phocaeicola massiliensis]|uniref:DEAD/DEAH box helicase family protein n=1 Tax=Phocaeicola massiliensis TaxID=204516 RepID=UPI000E41842B|nr:DEAD/DEAH box helicase family protein [Phocaeicola massiliensis]RGF00767.1 hypothetical protein DW267_05860 [Bacteroides sp. AM22-3LB]